MKKRNNKPIQKEMHQCKWCGKDKTEKEFIKYGLDRNIFICKECITEKYFNLTYMYGQAKAVLVCCHYLNAPFIIREVDNLGIYEGIGEYLRKCNLKQNRNNDFEQSLIDLPLDFHSVSKEEEHRAEMNSAIDTVIDTLNKLKGKI